MVIPAKRGVFAKQYGGQDAPPTIICLALRLEKVVANIQLRVAMEMEEDKRARPENDAATKRLRLAWPGDGRRKTAEGKL